MPSPEEEIKTVLRGLYLSPDDITQLTQRILLLREELAGTIVELTEKKLPRSLAIVRSLKASQMVDEITDMAIQAQGILERAMRGEDTHDAVAILKAQIESLIAGEYVEPRTMQHLRSTTSKMAQMKRKNFQNPTS